MNQSIESRHMFVEAQPRLICPFCPKKYLKTRKWQKMCVACMKEKNMLDKHPLCSRLISYENKNKNEGREGYWEAYCKAGREEGGSTYEVEEIRSVDSESYLQGLSEEEAY